MQKAIEFLSAQNMLHRNICISSIVVDLAGEWKLAGLELLHAEADAEDQIPPMETPDKYAPPELAKGGRYSCWPVLLARARPCARAHCALRIAPCAM